MSLRDFMKRRLDKRAIRSDDNRERVVHYGPVHGQLSSALCGYDGGINEPGEPADPVACRECRAIVAFFREA